MEKRATVQPLTLPAGRRVLVISDIHGNLPFFKGLLDKAAFSTDDILILLGDLVEKGVDSLATLRYMMELGRTHTLYPVCGNCDDVVLEFADGENGVDSGVFDHYLKVWGERSLLVQMGREAGLPNGGADNLPLLRETICTQFCPELDFLRGMPHVLLTGDYLFVHGGVPQEEGLEKLEAWRCMKNDEFLNKGYAFRRWCVVGHTPVTLYDPHIANAAPLLEEERHIASIDGGCCLKLDGQLNALILPERAGGKFRWVSYDGLETAVARDRQVASDNPVNVRWGRSGLEVLTRGAEFCRCRHLESGRELDVLTEFLRERNGTVCCEDSTDYRLPVQPGDRLSVVRRVTGGYLVKKDGVTGWYFGRIEEKMA